MQPNKLFSFEVIADKVKITYIGDKPLYLAITLVLRGGNKLDTWRHLFQNKNHWFIPNIDYKGCTHISLYDIDNKKPLFDWLLPYEITQGIDKQKIIGIGLNKTGTTSFEKDLKELGYIFPPTSHGAIKVLSDIYHNEYHSLYSYLNNPRFTAFQDLPYSLPNVYKKIYQNRPNDLYVLTVRENADKWVNSVLNYYKWLINGKNINGNNEVFEYFSGFESIFYSNFNVPTFKLWGLKSLDNLEKNLKEVYERHNNDVIDFFNKTNPQNFIVIDVSKDGELKKLTNWLGIENEQQNFSWENKKK